MNYIANRSSRPVPALRYTGERMVPEAADRFTFWEHVYRYGFACQFVAGKRVLDIACGEGYGTAALEKAGAESVIGVDVSSEACVHARDRYHIDARVGDAENIPVEDASVNLVVSFETIEHVASPARFLAECARVLVRGGTLIVSTPNKDVYSAPGEPVNPFHCSEMSESEFVAALQGNFRAVKMYTQRPQAAAWWSFRSLAVDTRSDSLGFGRVRRSAHFRFFPRAVYDPTPEERTNAVQQILAASRANLHPFNGYAVRRRRTWNQENPRYFIASAMR